MSQTEGLRLTRQGVIYSVHVRGVSNERIEARTGLGGLEVAKAIQAGRVELLRELRDLLRKGRDRSLPRLNLFSRAVGKPMAFGVAEYDWLCLYLKRPTLHHAVENTSRADALAKLAICSGAVTTLAKSRRLREMKQKSSAKTRAVRSAYKTDFAPSAKSIEWTEVASGFLGGVRPESKTWEHWREVAQRNRRSRERQQLFQKLGKEIIALYAAYRERTGGRYFSVAGEEKYAQEIALNCLSRNIHPADLLEYWHENIGAFTKMKFPPLTFLKGVFAADNVAAATAGSKAKHGNSHGDVSRHDPNLRKKLEAAGFDTKEITDRTLVTFQLYGHQRANGKRFILDPAYLEMVDWIAAEIYDWEGE